MEEVAEKTPKKRTTRSPTQPKGYELSANLSSVVYVQKFGLFDNLKFDIEHIREWLGDPDNHIEELRQLAWYIYRTCGAAGTAVDYLRSMHTLDGVISCRRRKSGGRPRNYKANAAKMSATLDKINYKQFIRDALLKDACDGMIFYYFETKTVPQSTTLFLSDVDVESIMEINEIGMNAAILSLPVEACRIVGRKNGVPIVAFNLRYFDSLIPNEKKRALTGMPKEIQEAYDVYHSSQTGAQNWKILNSDNTICTKICAPVSSKYGIPYLLRAIDEILYSKQFADTKRSSLNKLMNDIYYQTLPESSQKGLSSLSQRQQEQQHNVVRDAIMSQSSTKGDQFFTVAPGTKLEKLQSDASLFKDNVETDVSDDIPSSLGMAPTLLTGKSNATYASASLNAEFVAANVFMWISDIMAELNKAINANVIKDPTCPVTFEILPVTYVNRSAMFDFMKTLYADCGGSLEAVVAASGMNVEAYMSLMDHEREAKYDEAYPPHASMYTTSGSAAGPGRPTEAGSQNPSTQQTKSNNGNATPRPSVS